MTKKDYILIAEALAFAKVEASQNNLNAVRTFDVTVKYIAKFLQGDNSRFDKGRFESFVHNRARELA